MKVEDRVKMEPMWKYSSAEGIIVKIQKDGYVIVNWDGINGDWYYTPEQATRLVLIEKNKETKSEDLCSG